MDRHAVYEQLKIDEGVEYEIYLDHLGYPTFGVGHLVLETDPEHGARSWHIDLRRQSQRMF